MRILILFILTLKLSNVLGQTSNNALKISHLKGDFYIYTTYKDLGGFMFPSNSVYVLTDDGVVLIDTPWDSTQFQPLLDSISKRHNKKVSLVIATHYHDDRTAASPGTKDSGAPRPAQQHCK